MVELNEKEKALVVASSTFIMWFVLGNILLAIGYRFNDWKEISLGYFFIIIGILWGIGYYIWYTRIERLPETKQKSKEEHFLKSALTIRGATVTSYVAEILEF